MWAIKCQGRCGEAVPPLKTSASLYGDDFEINHQINFATSSCAVPFERAIDFMRTIGYGALLRSLHPRLHPHPPTPPPQPTPPTTPSTSVPSTSNPVPSPPPLRFTGSAS